MYFVTDIIVSTYKKYSTKVTANTILQEPTTFTEFCTGTLCDLWHWKLLRIDFLLGYKLFLTAVLIDAPDINCHLNLCQKVVIIVKFLPSLKLTIIILHVLFLPLTLTSSGFSTNAVLTFPVHGASQATFTLTLQVRKTVL